MITFIQISLILLVASTNGLAETAGVPAEVKFHTLESGRVVNTDIPKPHLANLKTKAKTVPVDDPNNLKPNRLYLRYEPLLKSTVFDITDANGQFPTNPPRALVAGSTIPGEWAGGESRSWYIFNGPDAVLEAWDEVPNAGKPGIYKCVLLNDPKPRKLRKYNHSVKPEDR